MKLKVEKASVALSIQENKMMGPLGWHHPSPFIPLPIEGRGKGNYACDDPVPAIAGAARSTFKTPRGEMLFGGILSWALAVFVTVFVLPYAGGAEVVQEIPVDVCVYGGTS